LNSSQQYSRVFASDCEGPISKNDNAFELASNFLPKGDYFFSLISKYDDYLADIVKRPGYRSGYTLKLITPFFKAFSVTNYKIEEYSKRNITLIDGSVSMLNHVKGIMPSFIISTSYEQYVYSLCRLIDFPIQNVYCTKLDLDKHIIQKTEINRLKQLEKEIISLSMIDIPKDTQSISQFSSKSRLTIKKLDNIFFEEIPKMTIGKMLDQIKPIGGEEKAESIRNITKRMDCKISSIMYVGDSITDIKALKLVKNGSGLTVSFNGNEYAVRNAEVAVLSNNSIIITVLADIFYHLGKKSVLELVQEWSYAALKKYCTDQSIIQSVINVFPATLPKVELVTQDNLDKLVEESSSFRRTVRGKAIGLLG
jgi:energy-converting hydrogenase A subunit R